DHEDRDIRVGTLVWLGALMAAVTIATFVAMGVMFQRMEAREDANDRPRPPMAVRGHPEPPAPRLEIAPSRTRTRQRAHEKEILTTYFWVDREQGVVRIPIERAMDLV